jgi:hypothetical protein
MKLPNIEKAVIPKKKITESKKTENSFDWVYQDRNGCTLFCNRISAERK